MNNRRERREEKLDRELRDHLELDAEAKMDRGLSAEQARYAAQRDFGNTTLVREVTREMWSWTSLERVWQDVRYGLRMIRRNPGFAVVAILTLALGIGANSAMFSIINGVLLRPLPYPEADRLINIRAEDRARGITDLNISYPRFTLIQEQSRTLESVGALVAQNSNLTVQGNPEQVESALATSGFFKALGVSPSMGRGFLPEEEQTGGANVAMITNAFWHNHFGGQQDVIGRTISIDARSVEIVGVLPASFQYLFQQPGPQIWFPRVFETSFLTPDRIRAGASFMGVIARVRPGVSIAAAENELVSLNDTYRKTYPGFYDAGRYTAHATSMKEYLVSGVRASLLVLLTAVGFVLLIGCTNLAGLLLARSTARRKEMAIRQALGASRGRLVRQLLTESLLLSFVGGGIGILMAANTPVLMRLLPPGTLLRINNVSMDSRVVWFSLALCILTGIALGVIPALQVSSYKLHDSLKEATRGSTGGVRAGRSRSALVVAQVAVALVLVCSAGLLIKSFGKLMQVSPGFDSDQVMTFNFSLPLSKYPHRPEQAEFYRRMVEAVQQAPGMQFAAVNTILPMASSLFTNICPEGIVCQGGGKDPVTAVRSISPDYFKTMRIPLLRGREFNQFDTGTSKIVCIVNESLANQYFPGQDAVGRFIVLPFGNIKMEIAGVVGDVKFNGLNQDDFAELYYPQQQSPVPVSASTLVVRSDMPAQPIVNAVREIARKLDSDLPVTNILSMNEVISTSVAQPRLTARLIAGFALLALTLAAIGIYGVMAYSVAQRKHEMAIRIALGAGPASILKLIAKQGLALIFAGIAIGIVATLALTRYFETILFQISAHDPFTIIGVTGLLIGVGMLACYIPARRAMSVDPITALRDE